MIVFLFAREIVASRRRHDGVPLEAKDFGLFFPFWPYMIIPSSVVNKSELALNILIVFVFYFAIWFIGQFALLTLLILVGVTVAWVVAIKRLERLLFGHTKSIAKR